MVKNPPANAGDSRDPGLIPGSGRSPGRGKSNPLQYFRLENPVDRGAWQAHIQSTGLQRVSHERACAHTHARTHTHTHVRNIEIDRQFNLSIGFPGSSDGKESACKVGDPGSIPELGRSPGEGNGNPLQYSCLENPMDGEAW